MSEWPEYYPPGCPPDRAAAANGEVYRFVSNPPKASDFDPHIILYPDRPFAVPLCQACGLSVNTSFADAQQKQAMVPALRKKKIAVGTLTSSDGRLQLTPSKNDPRHHTWWMSLGAADPLETFRLVEEARTS